MKERADLGSEAVYCDFSWGGNSIKCFLGTCLHASNGSKLFFSPVLCPLICVRSMIQFVQGLLWDGGTECQDEPGARAEFLCSRWTRNYQWRRREAKPIRLKKKISIIKVFTVEVDLQCWVNHSKVIQFYLYTHTYICICRYIYMCVCVCMYVYIYILLQILSPYRLLQNSIVPYAI